MTVLRASASDYTQAVKRNMDSKVVGKINPATAASTPIVSGKGTNFQLATLFRETYYQQPDRPARLGFLGNTGRWFPRVG